MLALCYRSECYDRWILYYKGTVLLESIDLRSYDAFQCSKCSNREQWSILKEFLHDKYHLLLVHLTWNTVLKNKNTFSDYQILIMNFKFGLLHWPFISLETKQRNAQTILHTITKSPVGLSQICSKFCPKGFQEFPKIFTLYSFQFPLCPHRAPRLTTFLTINF